jgi:hypothetical protein
MKSKDLSLTRPNRRNAEISGLDVRIAKCLIKPNKYMALLDMREIYPEMMKINLPIASPTHSSDYLPSSFTE